MEHTDNPCEYNESFPFDKDDMAYIDDIYCGKDYIYNVWFNGQNSVTTIIAHSETEALEVFYQRHGFKDYIDYCQHIYRRGGEHANVEVVL